MNKLRQIIYLMPKADAAWATVARVNAVFTSLVFVFLYTAEVGKSNAGSFLFWVGVVNIAAALGGLGRAQFIYALPVVGFVRSETAVIVSFVRSSIVWVCLCTAGFALIGLQYEVNSIEQAPTLTIVLLSMLTALSNFLAEVLRVLRRFAFAAIVNPGTIYLVLCMMLLLAERRLIEPKSMLLYLSFGQACIVIFALVVSCQTLGFGEFKVSYSRERGSIGTPLPKYLWPYWLNTIPTVFLYQIDAVIVGLYFGPEMLAVYTIASRLAGGLSFINSLAYVILPARISYLLIRGPKVQIGVELRNFAKGLSLLTFSLIMALILGISYDFPKLESEEAFKGFILLAAAHGVNCFLGARSVVLQLAGHARMQATISWTFALICSALLFLAVASGKFILVFVAVATSIVAQAITESWVLRLRLGISSVPGIPDRFFGKQL